MEQRVLRRKPFRESSEMCAEVFVQGRQGEEIVAVEAPSDMSCGAMIEKHSAGIYSSSCAYDLFEMYLITLHPLLSTTASFHAHDES